MPTYFPTGDGNVTFHQFDCQQIVTHDGLTIESPTCEALVAHGMLREGHSKKGTKHAHLPAHLSVGLVDYAAPQSTAPQAEPDTTDPTPPASDAAQPSGPAAIDSSPKGS